MGPWSCSVDVGAVATGVVCRSSFCLRSRQERRRWAAELDQVANTSGRHEFLADAVYVSHSPTCAAKNYLNNAGLGLQLKLEAQLGNSDEQAHHDSVQSTADGKFLNPDRTLGCDVTAG